MIKCCSDIFARDDDKLHEECGVVGIYLKQQSGSQSNDTESENDTAHEPVPAAVQSAEQKGFAAAAQAYYALLALQHRGQDSAGIAVSDGKNVSVHKAMGVASEIFTLENLSSLKGHIACAHVRYASSKNATVENAQPMVQTFKLGGIAVAHNGKLVNYRQLRASLEEAGTTFVSSSDTEVIIKLISKSYKKGLERSLADAVQMLKGSFALTVMTEQCLIGVRDMSGLRPLCLGKIKNGWILASESCAIDAVNGTYVRDIQPGEIVIINEDGVLSFEFGEHTAKRTCVFEYVFFARPDSVIDGIPVSRARRKMGACLARENPVPADVVIGVPDSGLNAALGYAEESCIPYAMGIVKNKYIGRAFIAPTQRERENMVFVKMNAVSSVVKGKRVVVVDDSIVRGTTSRRLVQILRRAGAKQVHFRISSPPVKFPCYFGINTPEEDELISSSHNVEQICREIGADSLAFISAQGMLEACRICNPNQFGFCDGCFTGEYPMSVSGE